MKIPVLKSYTVVYVVENKDVCGLCLKMLLCITPGITDRLTDCGLLEFFTLSNSVRSDRSRSQFPLSTFVGVKYLLMYTHSSKGQSA